MNRDAAQGLGRSAVRDRLRQPPPETLTVARSRDEGRR